MAQIRLNKYLASQGVASRRKIDQMVADRHIFINNSPATLGQKVDPQKDVIKVGHKIIPYQPPKLTYIILNKPKGYLSTTRDDRSRPTVTSLVKSPTRLFPVGRLDIQSTGLILLTNDGPLTLKLTHPRYHLPKVYLATFLGEVSLSKIESMRHGVELDDGRTAPSEVEFFESKSNHTTLKITLFEGKKRQIRRMAAALHLHLVFLHRISLGPIEIGNLAIGQSRPLTQTEINQLKLL
jgi:pseudouridine synthase